MSKKQEASRPSCQQTYEYRSVSYLRTKEADNHSATKMNTNLGTVPVLDNTTKSLSKSFRQNHPLKAKDGLSLRNSVTELQASGEEHEGRIQDSAAEVMLTTEEVEEVEQVKRMAQDDTNRLNRWRLVATFVLLVVALCVTYTTYRLLKKEETNNWETAFEQFSRTVGDAAIRQQQDLRNGLATLATVLATYGATNQANESFPFVTLPLFELMAQHAKQQGHIETLNLLPRVSAAQRYDWVQYANAQYQNWVQEGHLLQKGNLNRLVGDESTYHPFVSKRQADGSFLNETEQGFYYVSWQYSPPPATYDLINGNLFSVPQFARVANALLKLEGSETVFTNVFPHVGIPTAMSREVHDKLHSKLLDTRSENPHSFFVHAVHEAPVPGEGVDAQKDIVGVLAGASAWDFALLNLLPDGVVGLHAVIQNNCNQSYTYDIRGSDAYFLGDLDLHEAKYDDMRVDVNLALHTHPEFQSTKGHCQYQMHIYPSDEFRNSYDSNTPELFAVAVATTFVFVAIVFVVYDLLVQRRNHNLIVKAAQTNAIVYSLFPKKKNDEEQQGAIDVQETEFTAPTKPEGTS